MNIPVEIKTFINSVHSYKIYVLPQEEKLQKQINILAGFDPNTRTFKKQLTSEDMASLGYSLRNVWVNILSLMPNTFLFARLTTNEEKQEIKIDSSQVEQQLLSIPVDSKERFEYFKNLLCLEKRYPIVGGDYYLSFEERLKELYKIKYHISRQKIFLYFTYLFDLFYSSSTPASIDQRNNLSSRDVAVGCAFIAMKLFMPDLPTRIIQRELQINYSDKELFELEVLVLQAIDWTVFVPSINYYFSSTEPELVKNICCMLVMLPLPLKYQSHTLYDLATYIFNKSETSDKDCTLDVQNALVDLNGLLQQVSKVKDKLNNPYFSKFISYYGDTIESCMADIKEPESNCVKADLYKNQIHEIGKKIGEGMYGKVSVTKDERYVVKEFKNIKIHHELNLSILRELLIKDLKHPSIVSIEDFFYENDKIYLTMTKMKTDLSNFISTVKINLRNLKDIMKNIIQGLLYLKQWGIAHRDLKSSNILIDYNKEGDNVTILGVKIADFGLAKQLYNIKVNTSYVITLPYRPPEIIICEIAQSNLSSYQFEPDMWSAGCIMYELLTKRSLFGGMSELNILLQIFDIFGSPTKDRYKTLYSLMEFFHLGVPQFDKKVVFYFNNIKTIDSNCYDLLLQLLNPDPNKRITVEQAVKHPFLG